MPPARARSAYASCRGRNGPCSFRTTTKASSIGARTRANHARIAANTHPRPHQSGGGAVREGSALLQGLAVCGHCGRKLRTHYTGRTASAGYHCAGKSIVDGRGIYCLSVGAVQIDEAVARAVLAALAPLGVEAALAAAERIEADHDGALAQWRLAVERASYEAQRAERRYRAVDPDNRLVARGLEAEWESSLRELDKAKAELARREQLRPHNAQRTRAHTLAYPRCRSAQGLAGADHVAARQEGAAARVCSRKSSSQSTRTNAARISRCAGAAALSPTSTSTCPVLARQPCVPMRTRSRWCAAWLRIIPTPSSPASSIARIARALTAIASLSILSAIYADTGTSPVSSRPTNPPEGELLTIKQTADALGVATSTIHRWLNDGIIAGEQLTHGAPWRIRLTDDLRARVAEEAPDDCLTMYQTMRLLGVSRQTVWQRVKRGEIKAVHVRRGRRKGLRLKVIRSQPDLFEQPS